MEYYYIDNGGKINQFKLVHHGADLQTFKVVEETAPQFTKKEYNRNPTIWCLLTETKLRTIPREQRHDNPPTVSSVVLLSLSSLVHNMVREETARWHWMV